MGSFNYEEARDNADIYEKHEGHLSHEIIAGAAAYWAMAEFEKRQREKGEVVKHGFAKGLLASIAAAEAEKLAETKGLNLVDKERTKHRAKENSHELYDHQYGHHEHYDPGRHEAHEHIRKHHGW